MLLSFLFQLALTLTPARAETCWNDDFTFYNCDAHRSSAPASNAPMGADKILSNPAGLPVGPSPFGLEAIVNDRSVIRKKPKFVFSTVKGFDGIGFGVGSYTQGTFSAPNFRDHFLPTVYEEQFREYEAKDKNPFGLRLGTAVRIPTGTKFLHLRLGGSLGLGNVAKSPSKQLGLVLRASIFALGYSRSFERLAADLPSTTVDEFNAGIAVGPFFAGASTQLIHSAAFKNSSRTFSLRWTAQRWTLYGALKNFQDFKGAASTWHSAMVQRRFGKRLGVSYYYGVYPRSHGLGMQLYL